MSHCNGMVRHTENVVRARNLEDRFRGLDLPENAYRRLIKEGEFRWVTMPHNLANWGRKPVLLFLFTDCKIKSLAIPFVCTTLFFNLISRVLSSQALHMVNGKT